MRENITKMKKKNPDPVGFEHLPTSNHRLAVRSANHYTTETVTYPKIGDANIKGAYEPLNSNWSKK